MPIIMLYEGECDGYWEQTAFSMDDKPGIFYAVPLADAADITGIKDPLAKEAAKKAYSRLAYVFEEVKATEDDGMIFCYKRCAERDKAANPDPAPPP